MSISALQADVNNRAFEQTDRLFEKVNFIIKNLDERLEENQRQYRYWLDKYVYYKLAIHRSIKNGIDTKRVQLLETEMINARNVKNSYKEAIEGNLGSNYIIRMSLYDLGRKHG